MIEGINIIKSFKNGEVVQNVLKGVSLKIETGEFVAIMGRSGAGKSTLMYQLGLLDHPTSGEIIIDGKKTFGLSTSERTLIRLNDLGFIFQDYAVLPELDAIENVMVPLLMQGIEYKKAFDMSKESLRRVGLEKKLFNLPSQMSGGEQQRVSIARAIAHKPKILFADEPTANLDTENSKNILAIFKELNKQGQTIVMVTHEDEFGEMTDRIIRLQDGQII